MRTALAVAVAVGLGCGAPADAVLPGPAAVAVVPDTVYVEPPPGPWSITGEEIPFTREILDIVREQAQLRGGAAYLCDDVGPWAGAIDFVPERAYCGSTLAVGCAWLDEDDAPRVWVTNKTYGLTGPGIDLANQNLLIHELGHIAFARCGLGGGDHPPEFYAWISGIEEITAPAYLDSLHIVG